MADELTAQQSDADIDSGCLPDREALGFDERQATLAAAGKDDARPAAATEASD